MEKTVEPSPETVSLLISGKVQGVFYRQATREKALQLGITGSVRNLPGKQVQVIASGTPEQLQELVAWCKQGPPRAEVTRVEIAQLPFQLFPDFIIER